MSRIERPKLSDMAAEAVVQFITHENLQPGDKLPTEKELSDRLGIGRTSVREGIRQLDAVGLLATYQGKGVYLREVTIESLFASQKRIPVASFLTLSKNELLDILAIRLMIESEACQLAAERIQPHEIEELQAIQLAMLKALARREEFIAYDIQFHKQILVASGNVILPKLFEFIRDLYSKQLTLASMVPQAMERALHFHEKILSALENKHTAQAVEYLHQHLEDTKKELMTSF